MSTATTYQQIEKKFVLHSRNDFDSVPAIGNIKSISSTIKARLWFRPMQLKSAGICSNSNLIGQ
ncbi:KfrB domain-containing protein [Methylosarcina fibrata]